MATHFVDIIQKNLGLPPLQKIDPNIQETKDKVPSHSKEKLAQAAIPAVLTALYKYTRTDEGCEAIISASPNSDWLATIFERREKSAVDKVAQYAGVEAGESRQLMNDIAANAVDEVKKAAGNNPSNNNVREYLANQRHNILVHLPAAMQMGDLLNDEALDDRTNKMEGPISNLMHSIEGKLSKGDQSKYP